MQLRNAEETKGTTGVATPKHRWGPDGALGDGRGWALSHHLDGAPIQGIDGEREFRLGGTPATWRTCRNPGFPTSREASKARRKHQSVGADGSYHSMRKGRKHQ